MKSLAPGSALARHQTWHMLMKKSFSIRSVQTTAFQATSQTDAAELTDFHTRFAFGGDAFGCAVAAS